MFIVIDGIDGAGKTTVATLLHETLSKTIKGTLSKPLGHDAASKLIRKIALDPEIELVPEAYPYLLIADLIHFAQSVVIPTVISGNYLIVDRYVASTWVYQVETNFSLSKEQKDTLSYILATNVPAPDYTFILDASENITEQRLNNVPLEFNGKDQFEKSDMAEKTRRRVAYLSYPTTPLGLRSHTRIINTDMKGATPEHIVEYIINYISKHKQEKTNDC
jgi:dTMP kinase